MCSSDLPTATATPTATVTPTVTATPTATATAEPMDGGDTAETPTPTPDKVVVTIVVSALPEGTTAIQLPDGTIVELSGLDTMDIEVDAAEVGDDGSLELIALDKEGTPLGVYGADGQRITTPDTGSAGGIWPVLMWVLIGIAAVGVAGLVVYLIFRRKTT